MAMAPVIASAGGFGLSCTLAPESAHGLAPAVVRRVPDARRRPSASDRPHAHPQRAHRGL
ncbi:hypothetical protein ABTY53_15180 [Streptomyces noursei]|uniref:hypothetical protein n=1 Tax=Streptomyces noursei TaxID=1971 RepID=UPI003316C93D